MCDADGNDPTVDDDAIVLAVDSGPYLGCRNRGNPSGNITVES